MKIHEFAVCACLLLASEMKAQVWNDSCTGATPILVWTTDPCTFQLGSSGDHWAGDSTDNATINFPYPSNPNPCFGYSSSMGPPGRDVWFRMGYSANAYVWEMTCSDTCHLSWWAGDCGTLAPLECYTILPNVPTYTEASLPVGVWSNQFYIQVVAKNSAVDITFDACWTYFDVFGGGGAVFVQTEPTPVICSIDSISITQPTLSTSADGGIEVIVLTGHPPFAIMWNDGNTTFHRTGLVIGEYAYQITDGVGCVQSDTILLDLSTELSAGQEVGAVIHWSCDPSNGDLIVTRDIAAGDCEVTLLDLMGRCVLQAGFPTSELRLPGWVCEHSLGIADFRFADRPPLRSRLPVCLTN
jgi:hypothetical protein